MIIGQTVFYLNLLENKIYTSVIKGIDMVDGILKYWLKDFFGYIHKDLLFEEKHLAEERRKNDRLTTDKIINY